MKRVSVAEAKNNLPALLHEAAETGPIEIVRYDEPVAVIVAHDDFQRLRRGPRAPRGTWAAIAKWRRDHADILGELELGRHLKRSRDQKPPRGVDW